MARGSARGRAVGSRRPHRVEVSHDPFGRAPSRPRRPRRCHRGAGVPHPTPHRGRPRRQLPVGAGMSGRLAAGLPRDPARLRRRGRRVAGDLHRPGRQLGVQGGARRKLGRELRAPRDARRSQHPARAGRRRAGEVLLRPRDPLDRRRPHLGHRRGAGELPVGARLRLGLGPGVPALLAAGPGRRRRLHLPHARATSRELRGQGRHRRELGRELRRRGGPERSQHPLRGSGRLRGDAPFPTPPPATCSPSAWPPRRRSR
jgi:hypothetical protein